MKLEQSFEVDAPLEKVWSALIDVQQVAPCLPGAELTEVGEDGTYHGTFSVKIGPATAAYRGTLKMEEVDEAAHKVTMRASGTDKRGQGGAKALMHSQLTERDGGGTRVVVETDLTITGRLASFSRGGMIQDVSNRLMGEFAACLASSLKEEPAPAQPGPGAEAGAGAGAAAAGAAPAGEPPAGERPQAPAGQRPPAKPINAFRLLLGVLRDRILRLLRRLRDLFRRRRG
jgi:carbon monoxide dehydrogenase subunit G